jgi:hypothetical protein
VAVVMWLKNKTRVREVIWALTRSTTCAGLMTGFGRLNFLTTMP